MIIQLLVFIKYIKKTDNYTNSFCLLNERIRMLQDTKKQSVTKPDNY
jgi:hypothetical protein